MPPLLQGWARIAGAALTDNHGYASDYWTLGPSLEVGANRLEVRAVDPATHTKQMFASFEATGIEGPPPGDPIEEVCDGTDTSGNGLIDDGLPYCFNGVPAPNTDGAVCLDGYYDMDGIAETGCESDSPEFSICHTTLEFDSPDLPLGWSATMDGVEEGYGASLVGALSGGSSVDLLIQAWGSVILSNEGAVSPGVEALTIAWTQDHLQIAEFYEARFTAGDPENGQPWWRMSLTRSDDWVDRYRLEIGDGEGEVAVTDFTQLDGFYEGTLTHFFTVREGELHIEARDGLGPPLAQWTQELPGFQPLQGSHWSFEVRSWEGGDDDGSGHDLLKVYDFSSRCSL
jgi:hypothetical protein